MINYKLVLEKKNTQLHYIDTDCLVLAVKTEHIINDLKNPEDLFHIINLSQNHELFSNKNEKVIGKRKLFKIEKLD